MKSKEESLSKLGVALAALDKLSRLGNEPHVGNSIGNTIARDALDKIEKIEVEHEIPASPLVPVSEDVIQRFIEATLEGINCEDGVQRVWVRREDVKAFLSSIGQCPNFERLYTRG